MLSVILTITGRFICSANSYCDNNENNGGGGGGYICNANSYCGNKGEVYMQSEQLL